MIAQAELTMQIAEKTVVQFHYDLSDADGPIESSREHFFVFRSSILGLNI